MLRFHFVVFSVCISTRLLGCDQSREQKYPPTSALIPLSLRISKPATARKKKTLRSKAVLLLKSPLTSHSQWNEVWGSLRTCGMFMQTEALAVCPAVGNCANPSPNERRFGAFSLPGVYLQKAPEPRSGVAVSTCQRHHWVAMGEVSIGLQCSHVE